MSESAKEKIFTPEHRRKMSEARKGLKYSIEVRAKRVGEKNPNWKGGITELANRIRTSSEYVSWRMGVFQRDGFVCVNCNFSKGGILEADHIKPFSIILREHGIVSFADALNCAELWDIKNGRTLCSPCHKKIGWSFFKNENPRKHI